MRVTWMLAAVGFLVLSGCNKSGGLEGEVHTAEPAKAEQKQTDLTGKIARATASEIQLENHPQVVKVDASTQVTLNGRTVSVEQLPAGAEVRVSLRTVSGEARASKIEAKTM
jgi:outer membrane lipoprotein SlyB